MLDIAKKGKSWGLQLFLMFLIVMSCRSTKGSTKSSSSQKLKETSNRTAQESILIESELQKKSRIYYEKLLASGEYQDVLYDKRLIDIKRIVNRLSFAGGYGSYNKPIHLVISKSDPNSINAFVLPSGEIFVYESLADVCEKKAIERGAGDPETTKNIYEGLLASVLGHELGHYFGKHQLKSILRKQKNLSNSEQVQAMKSMNPEDLKPSSILKDIEWEQELEIESDWFAYHIMVKAGMSPLYVKDMLEILKKSGTPDNPYTSTHPSLNKRISNFEENGEKKDFQNRMLKLEYAFGAIEVGVQLNEAASTLKKELQTYPNNPYLLSALGKVYHRLWEESCEISEIRFKSSIVFTPFQENMVHPSSKGLSLGKIPRKFWCDKTYYLESLNQYELAIKNFAGPYTMTSYSVLLSYHPERYKSAINVGIFAFNQLDDSDEINRIRFINNLGIVFFMNEQFIDAEKMFNIAAQDSLNVLTQTNLSRETDQIVKKLNNRNMGTLLEGFYNLGGFYYQLSQISDSQTEAQMYLNTAKSIWNKYIQIDHETEWGRFAAGICLADQRKLSLNFKKPKVTIPETRIKGDGSKEEITHELVVGEKASILSSLEGQGSKNKYSRGYSRGFSRGYSRGLTVSVYEDKILGIRLDRNNSYPVMIDGKSNPITVGMTKSLLLSTLGEPQLKMGNISLYPNYYLMIKWGDGDLVESIHISAPHKI